VTAVGLATPINAPTLNQPAAGQNVSGSQATGFSTNSVLGTSQFTAEYVLEFSSTINFAKGTWFRAATFTSNQSGLITSPAASVNPATFFPNATSATPIYWRYGARNIADVPGPTPDAYTKERYIFCVPRAFFITGTPPPPPRSGSKHRHVGTRKGG